MLHVTFCWISNVLLLATPDTVEVEMTYRHAVHHGFLQGALPGGFFLTIKERILEKGPKFSMDFRQSCSFSVT